MQIRLQEQLFLKHLFQSRIIVTKVNLCRKQCSVLLILLYFDLQVFCGYFLQLNAVGCSIIATTDSIENLHYRSQHSRKY